MAMLESRTDVQKQISQVVGQTDNDREDHIPYLLVQLQKDMAVVVEALSISSKEILMLKGCENVHGLKKRVSDIVTTTKALALLQCSCSNILSLTKRKKYIEDAERRFSVAETHAQKLSKAKLYNNNHKQISEKDSILHGVKLILSRCKNVQKAVDGRKPSSAVNTPLKKSRCKSTRRDNTCKDISVMISLTDGREIVIAPPTYDSDKKIYTVRELIMILSPYEGLGLKTVVRKLKDERRCLVAPSTFIKKLKAYKLDNNDLPEEGDYGGLRGRKPNIATKESTSKLNKIEHENVSYSGDGIEESRNALTESKKRKAKDSGVIDHQDKVHRYTAAAYDTFSTIFDPEISKVNGTYI